MPFDPDLTACAQLVERGDPDRFRAVMAAPVKARLALFPLYAMNVEIARAPWVTQETMIAEMRLQWWRDALDEIARGGPVRRHEVVTPLVRVLTPDLAGTLDDLVLARRWDIYRDPFEDRAAFDDYIDRTSGNLLWVACRALAGPGDPAGEPVVRDFGYAMGVANWLKAVPELEAKGRIPLVDGTAEAVRQLAAAALDRLARARASRSEVSPAMAPALLSGWQAGAILRQASRDPGRVAAASLGRSEARTRLSLMARAAANRW